MYSIHTKVEFLELEERISAVAARVVHLGNQLEGVNTPREHAFDAQKLMGYFSEFLDGEPTSDVLVNPIHLNETADIIRKDSGTKKILPTFLTHGGIHVVNFTPLSIFCFINYPAPCSLPFI